MSTSAIGTVLDAIRAALILRAGLSGVNVFSGVVSLEEAGLECLAYDGGLLAEDSSSMGGNKLEVWDIDGEIRVFKPWAGDTELTIKAARDRALAIFAELETHLNDTYAGNMPDVEVIRGEIAGAYNPEGRICNLTFTMKIQALKNP